MERASSVCLDDVPGPAGKQKDADRTKKSVADGANPSEPSAAANDIDEIARLTEALMAAQSSDNSDDSNQLIYMLLDKLQAQHASECHAQSNFLMEIRICIGAAGNHLGDEVESLIASGRRPKLKTFRHHLTQIEAQLADLKREGSSLRSSNEVLELKLSLERLMHCFWSEE